MTFRLKKRSGILHSETYSDKDWEKYGDNIALEEFNWERFRDDLLCFKSWMETKQRKQRSNSTHIRNWVLFVLRTIFLYLVPRQYHTAFQYPPNSEKPKGWYSPALSSFENRFSFLEPRLYRDH